MYVDHLAQEFQLDGASLEYCPAILYNANLSITSFVAHRDLQQESDGLRTPKESLKAYGFHEHAKYPQDENAKYP